MPCLDDIFQHAQGQQHKRNRSSSEGSFKENILLESQRCLENILFSSKSSCEHFIFDCLSNITKNIGKIIYWKMLKNIVKHFNCKVVGRLPDIGDVGGDRKARLQVEGESIFFYFLSKRPIPVIRFKRGPIPVKRVFFVAQG